MTASSVVDNYSTRLKSSYFSRSDRNNYKMTTVPLLRPFKVYINKSINECVWKVKCLWMILWLAVKHFSLSHITCEFLFSLSSFQVINFYNFFPITSRSLNNGSFYFPSEFLILAQLLNLWIFCSQIAYFEDFLRWRFL